MFALLLAALLINSYMYKPRSNSLPPKAASHDSKAYRTLSIAFVGVIGMMTAVMGGCIPRDAANSNLANRTPSATSSSPSPGIAGSPATASNSPTHIANSAYEGWPLPPLVAGDWVAVDKQASRNLLDHLVEHSPTDLIGTARQITQFRTKRLSFYPGAKLCEGLVPAVGSGEASIFSFILLPDDTVTLLDGTATPVHEMDDNIPVVLDTREQVESYLRFFAAAIFANGGNFRIVDAVDDPLWARDASESDKQKAAKYIRPLALERLNDGRWKASATVQYGTALSSVIFYLDPDGGSSKVEMADDVTVTSNLPLRREAFNGPLRNEIGLYK